MFSEPEMQLPSLQTYESKYQLKDINGNIIDNDIDETYIRVATGLSNIEEPDLRKKWFESFLWALRNGASPGGRIISNIGAEKYKPNTSSINCVVSSNIKDSIEGIMQAAKEAAITLSKGSGIGYCFSSLRPKGSYIHGVGALTSGSMSFMTIFDTMCFTINSAGGRRGAQMGTHFCWHPDIEEFITCKREKGRLRQFNLSVLITNEFLKAVEKNSDWDLYFPIHKEEHALSNKDLKTAYKYFPFDDDNYIVDKSNSELKLCKIYKTVKALDLWNIITSSTYDYSEPGILLYDRLNSENNLWFCENLVATNPCGEQALPEFGACWTGDMRLNTNYGNLSTIEAFNLSKTNNLKIAVDSLFTKNNTTTILKDCKIQKTGNREVFKISYTNGQEIKLTANHLIWTNKGWKQVKDLLIGDICYSQKNELQVNEEMELISEFDRGRFGFILDYHLANSDSTIKVTKKNHIEFLKSFLKKIKVGYTITDNNIGFSKNNTIVEYCLNNKTESENYKIGYLYCAYRFKKNFSSRPNSFVTFGSKYICEKIRSYQNEIYEFDSYPPCKHTKERVAYRVKLLNDIDHNEIEAPFIDKYESEFEEYVDYYGLLGWMLADGWLTYDSNSPSCGFSYNSEDDGARDIFVPLFEHICDKKKTIYNKQCENTIVSTIRSDKREIVDLFHNTMNLNSYKEGDLQIPSCIYRGNLRQQSHFISAVFGADGCISANNKLSLTSASKKWLQDIQLLLLNFGIHSNIKFNTCDSGTYGLYVKERDYCKFYAYIGFKYNKEKHDRLENKIQNQRSFNNRHDIANIIVEKIENIGFHEVYDIEEYSTNTLIVNGIVVHNCLLGAVNLTKFIENPFIDTAKFDFEKFKEVCCIFTRMLDNVVELNGLAIPEQIMEIIFKRRHGMGFYGLGSALSMLKIKYGSPESIRFTEEITKILAYCNYKTGCLLAIEKHAAPVFSKMIKSSSKIYNKLYSLSDDIISDIKSKYDNFEITDSEISPKILWCISDYMLRFRTEFKELWLELLENGCRFTHATTIAPVGTVSLSIGNNASNGIEPSFSHQYKRNIIRSGNKSKEQVDVYSYEYLLFKHLMVNGDSMKVENLPDYFITSDQISVKEHVLIQAAAQKWIDSSISKTVNVPTNYSFDDFKKVYTLAYENGLKGCATFRFNPNFSSGVLVDEENLKNTKYEFSLDNGKSIIVNGNENVFYDGQVHNAANLYDSIKEGYYGKF